MGVPNLLRPPRKWVCTTSFGVLLGAPPGVGMDPMEINIKNIENKEMLISRRLEGLRSSRLDHSMQNFMTEL